MQKIRIGILFGGQSREREVSFAGGRTVYDNLDKRLFEAIPIFIDSFGNFCELQWECVYKGSIRDFYPPAQIKSHPEPSHQRARDFAHLPELPMLQYGFQVYAESVESLTNDPIAQHALLQEIGVPLSIEMLRDRIDFAFLALHGTHGEDGSIQGLLEWYGIPYSGSGIMASAMGVNKAIQKDFQTIAGLYVNAYQSLTKNAWFQADELQKKAWFLFYAAEFKNQFVIKPAHQGSSLGVSILKNPDFKSFCEAVDLAFFRLRINAKDWLSLGIEEKIRFIKQLCDLRSGLGLPVIVNESILYLPEALLSLIDAYLIDHSYINLESPDSESMVLIESMIHGKEFSCIVVDDEQGHPFALPPTEILKNGDLFDYRSKYLPGLSKKVTPIDVLPAVLFAIRQACCSLYTHFGFEVYARIDGFVTEEGTVFLNDPNTTSGMMPSSFFFHQAAEIGLNPSAFLALIYFNSLRARIRNHPKGNRHLELLKRSETIQKMAATHSSAKKQIAIMMGGYSFERHISMESGRNIYEKLSSSIEFEPIPIFLTGNSHQYRLFRLPLNMMLKDNADDIRDKILHPQENLSLDTIRKESEALTCSYVHGEINYNPEEIHIEALPNFCEGVFIALHGRPGEDGTLQKDLARLNLYFNGSLSHSAAITINKFETNKTLHKLGFLVAKHAMFNKTDWLEEGELLAESICQQFGLPLIAKPADDGCSAAVRKISSASELNWFMMALFRESEQPTKLVCEALNIRIEDELPRKSNLLIEEFIQKSGAAHFLEVTCGMLTHTNPEGEIYYEIFEPSESLAESAILSLEEKFLAGQGQNLTPSRFSRNPKEQVRISGEVRKTLESVAKALDVTGYCRIDAFVRIFEDGKVETVIIEVNSLPGMTPATCIYHQAAINGYKPFEFIREILKFGETRKM